MAKKVTVTLVDDFDGEGAADETVEFGLDGVTYEIDLSTKNAAKLRNDLKQWVEARPSRRWSSSRPFELRPRSWRDRPRAERRDPGMGPSQRPQRVDPRPYPG